jgi:hypothetical protein
VNAAEAIPVLAHMLGRKPAPIAAPWSTCELKLTEPFYEELLQQVLALPRYLFDRFRGEQAIVYNIHGHRVSNRLALGLALTMAIAEYARRQATEGQFWTVIARRFEEAGFYTRLFTTAGQPTSLCRELLEQTARAFNLRHIYGQEGHKEWYSSVVLQFGFTRRGFERRLAEWLAGQNATLATRMLLADPMLRSPSFSKTWEALWSYRKGNRTMDQARRALVESSWVLPEWTDSLLRVACERRELDALATGNWEEDSDATDAFLSEPTLIWEAPAEPYLKTTLVHLADLNLQAPDYAVRVGEMVVGRLLRQPDGSYHADKGGEIRLPFVAGCLQVELASPVGEIAATQEIEVSEKDAEATLYDATTGQRITDADGVSLVHNHSYVLLLADDLQVHPAPIAVHTSAGPGFKAVALPPYAAGAVRVSLEGEVLWEWSIVPRHTVDSSAVKLNWGNYFDDGHAGMAYTRLILPDGWELRRAQKDFSTLDFTGIGNGVLQSDAFTITPDDHAHDVRIVLHLRFERKSVRKNCRLTIPGKCVLWQKRGEPDYIIFDDEKPLYTFSAQHDRFVFRLPITNGLTSLHDVAQHYRQHVLMEGAFFHRRLGQKPIPLGQLHGFGQALVVKHNGFNTYEPVLEVAEAVFDTGIVNLLRIKENESPALELRQPIYPGPEHVVVIVASDLSLSAHPCEVAEGTQNHRLILPVGAPLANHVAIGVFYRGIRLGSIWNHQEADRLRDFVAAGPDQTLRVARVMRVFKFPLLSEGYARFSRALVLNNLTAFVAVWMEEQPIQLDGVELKSPGLDDAAAYAFAELARLSPLEINEDSVITLVETYGSQDPLADPATALFRVAVELGRLSPRLAADVVLKWLASHRPYFRAGIAAHQILPSLRALLLGGLTEAQLLDQVSKATGADEHFIQLHLQNRNLAHWETNVRSLQHLLPFRALLTRAFLNNL